MLSRRFPSCCVLLACSALTSCRAERHLMFFSEPAAASVILDGKFVGLTPLDLRFESYGNRHVAIQKPGFRTHAEVLEIESPWYFVFPLDYVSEIFLPFGWEDIHRLEVVLEKQTGDVSQPDLDAVLQRAESLRRASPAGPSNPMPSASENQ